MIEPEVPAVLFGLSDRVVEYIAQGIFASAKHEKRTGACHRENVNCFIGTFGGQFLVYCSEKLRHNPLEQLRSGTHP